MSAQFPNFAAWQCGRGSAADKASDIDDAYYNDIRKRSVVQREVSSIETGIVSRQKRYSITMNESHSIIKCTSKAGTLSTI
jgi:hypothetical protein